jgi:hypothetical protein
VALSTGSSGPPLVLGLSGPPARRVTRPFLLLGDRDDAAAGAELVLAAAPGGTLELRYRDGVAAGLRVGPSAIYEIPVRFVAVGTGLPPTPEIERALDLRLAQANGVWEPYGRRFKRGPIVRLESCRGLLLIRGRAAGADGQGRPSRCGVLLDGKEVSVPVSWKNDGAPMTPKATARALTEKIGRTFQVDAFGGLLAGDRDAVVLRVRHRDGTPAGVERLAEGNDVAQAVTPLPADAGAGVEAAPSGELLSLDELAVLAAGRGTPADGFDVFVVSSLRSFQARPAYKVYPDGLFPASLSGSALVSWSILDGSGTYPYGLARVAGELLLRRGCGPARATRCSPSRCRRPAGRAPTSGCRPRRDSGLPNVDAGWRAKNDDRDKGREPRIENQESRSKNQEQRIEKPEREARYDAGPGYLLLIAVIFVGVAHGSPQELWSPEALVVSFGGAIIATFAGLSMQELREAAQALRIAFTVAVYDYEKLIADFVAYAGISRKDGLLGLEKVISNISDGFMSRASRWRSTAWSPTWWKSAWRSRWPAWMSATRGRGRPTTRWRRTRRPSA